MAAMKYKCVLGKHREPYYSDPLTGVPRWKENYARDRMRDDSRDR